MSWSIRTGDDPAGVLETMRATGHVDLHRHVTNFLTALALEAGAATDAGKELPGLPMGDERYNIEMPGAPVLISYTRYPGLRAFRVTDLVWLHTG